MTDMTAHFEGLVQNYWSQSDDMPVAPTNVYVSLHTADESNDPDGANEVGAGDYGRAETAPADWTVVAGNGPTTVENANDISFGDPTSSWGTVTHFGIWDASTGGNALWFGSLTASEEITSDKDDVLFEAGDISVSLN